MNYLVFLKLGGISNACGNDLPDGRPSPLETFGQLGAVIVAIRQRGPAFLGSAVMPVRTRGGCSVRSRLDRAIGMSQPVRPATARGQGLPAGPSLSSRVSVVCTFAGEKVGGYERAPHGAPVSRSDGPLLLQPESEPLRDGLNYIVTVQY